MSLLDLFNLLRRNWKSLVIVPLITLVLTAAVSWFFLPDKYTSTTSVYALAKGRSEGQNSVSSSDLTASQMLANDFTQLVKNERIQSDTAEALGREDLEDFDISVNSSATTRVIKVEVTGDNPQEAAKVANSLVGEIQKTALEVMDIEALNIISKADVPETPSGPNRVLFSIAGFLAGLLAALVFVVLRRELDTTIRSEDELKSVIGVPVIGRMPKVKVGSKRK